MLIYPSSLFVPNISRFHRASERRPYFRLPKTRAALAFPVSERDFFHPSPRRTLFPRFFAPFGPDYMRGGNEYGSNEELPARKLRKRRRKQCRQNSTFTSSLSYHFSTWVLPLCVFPLLIRSIFLSNSLSPWVLLRHSSNLLIFFFHFRFLSRSLGTSGL